MNYKYQNRSYLRSKMKETLSVLFIFKYIYSVISVDPIVITSRGLIKGLRAEHGSYSMFLGVPYGVVDEGNPFGDSTPHPVFKDTFEAYNDTIICLQYVGGKAIGNIDCLRLNIYVPDIASSRNTLPVMVYIHGGSFVVGSGKKESFNPNFLLKHDVIIVTMNYRLGPYGFLCVSNPEFNNQGMRDQILAMKWVKDNIKDFGGDATKITVFGQSAGAMTLDLLLLVMEDKLFSRAIIQSGTALSPWTVGREDDSIVLRIAAYFGFNCDNATTAINCLTKINPSNVITAANELNITDFNGHPLTTPCVETNGEDSLLVDYPVNLHPKVKGLDIMIGHTNKEVMFMYPESDEEFYENYKFSDELMKGFDEVYDEDTVRDFYIGNKSASQNDQSAILDFGSDIVFIYPVERTVARYLDGGANKVYRYVFAYEGGRNKMKVSKNLTSEGAAHGDDLGYLFDYEMFAEKPSKEDQAMIDRMTEMWTNFAKYGDPTPTATELIPVQWQPVNKDMQHYMLLGSPLVAGNRPFNKRMAFWKLYYKLYGNFEKRIKHL